MPAPRAAAHSVSRVSNIYASVANTYAFCHHHVMCGGSDLLLTKYGINIKTAPNRCKAMLSIVWRRRCAHHCSRAHLFAICQQRSIHYCTSPSQSSQGLQSPQRHVTIQSRATIAASRTIVSQISREEPLHRRTIERSICVLGHPSMLRM